MSKVEALTEEQRKDFAAKLENTDHALRRRSVLRVIPIVGPILDRDLAGGVAQALSGGAGAGILYGVQRLLK